MNTLNDHDDDDDDDDNENKSPSSYYSDDDDADRDTNDDDDCRSLATTTPSLLAQPETRAVRRGKWGVAAVLILAATGIATAVYTIVARSEATAFETHYADDSAKLLQTLGNRLDESLSVLDSLAVGLHTVAAATNQSWPTVTHPQFALSMAKVLPLTHAVVVSFLPLVKNAQRPEWQDYAERHHDEWIEQGKKVQYEWNGYYGPVLDIVNDENDDTTNNNTTTASFLWNNSILHSDFANLNDTVTRDFLPLWQNFPVIPNTTWTYNWDWFSFSYPESYSRSLDQQKAVMAEAFMLPDPGDPVAQAETQVWADYYSNYIAPDEEPVEPMSDLIYPIVVPSSGNTNDDDVNVDIWMNRATEDQNNKNASTAVGLIVATLYWRDMIRNILPQGSNGIHIVFDVCGANWTYQINGPNVEYLGVGDWHDSRYQSLGIHSQQEFEFRDPLYSGAPIDTSYCNYTVHLYPSSVLKNAHTTNQPIVFTVVVLLVFVFTSVVFFVYDVMVERRQKSILSTAVRSSAIVSSLFPSAVRDRLFHSTAVANREEATSSPSKHQTQRFSILSPSSPIKQKAPIKKSWGVSDNTSLGILQSRHISEGIADAPEINDESRAFLLDGSPPIAELYPETTVLFADIAGFTNWSSSRQPTQVFRLLETLYAAFDEIAKQRKIFKIETIGDCYVAVVGLPTPRKDHAIVMVRFANDCIHRMKQVVNDLEPSLGQDTSALALRVGLNSGPTTAGVLRGEKSRFQLFGDTVNTAARMESNGSPNRIHISQHTAELIELSGKGRWLKQREDQVNCKGKGWMTTFWCEPRPFSYASSVCSISLEDDLPNVERPTVRCSIDERLVDWCVNVFMDLLNDIVEHRNSQSVDKDTTAQHENPSESSKSCQINRSADVARQLHDFVSKIAIMYGGIDRPFHCFERCCHVAMTAKRLLDQTTKLDHELSNKVVLTSDPLTHFAIVFSAIIHGVDQPLVAHEDKCLDGLRLVHLNDSKSANIACDLLMDNRFEELRACIFESTSELDSWRQTVVNLVKSTNAMRAKRWEESSTDSGEYSDTLISELLLQAADVSHTMQHFSIYKKWNHRLCLEFFMLIETDYPVDWWYENELSFIDRCIIPLARSLCKIGICGGRECLVYSQENRKEWTLRGRELIQEARLAQISRATATIE